MDILEVAVKLAKWGNSLAVRVPKDVAERLGLKEGDELAVQSSDAGELVLKRELSFSEWVDSLSRYRGLIPADYKFDREEINRRG